jgi:hypothetical protein
MTMTGLPPGLDPEVCDRARLARDRAFDGLFFTGVRTTRIYCRPVCPVRPAHSANVRFFGSAAAAERAGFRPCLRCRPETAPGSPAWSGTATTVARGIRLIDEGFLNEASDRPDCDAAFRDCLHCRISQRAAVQRRFPGHLWTFAILAPRSRKMIAEMPMLTGGRFCGAMRYEADGKPFHETNCHCSICR